MSKMNFGEKIEVEDGTIITGKDTGRIIALFYNENEAEQFVEFYNNHEQQNSFIL